MKAASRHSDVAKTDRKRSARAAGRRLGEVHRQAADHRATRLAHRTELAEDYVEVMAELIDTTGEARAVDIARRLGVSQVTVTRAVERLAREKLVTTKPYRAIFLTPAGRRLAERVRRRHQLVVEFLLTIGVREVTARADSEGIEHHVSDETLAAFERVIQQKTETSLRSGTASE